MKRLFAFLLLITFGLAAPALAQAPAAQVASPNGVLAVAITLDGDGRPHYAVTRYGSPVITASRLGFILTDAPKLERGFVLQGQETRSVNESWEQPWGEWRTIRNSFNELRVQLQERTPLQRRLDIVFRVYDDGLGFRYEFPEQPNLTNVNIGEELTEFNVASNGTAWWIPAFEWNREEYLYNRTRVDAVGVAQTPMTIRTDDGLHIAFHEAALLDYSGMNLAHGEGLRFRAVLTPGIGAAKVERTAPFPTPWRTMQIADTAGGLYMSNLILNLNEPNAIGDVSWFRPQKYIGIWWQMHLNQATWGPGERHGATTETTLRYIDFAARNGFGGVLVEGWNEGWNDDWFANGEDFSFTEAYPDFDIERITAYARQRGVRLIGHHETAANLPVYERQLEAALDLYARLGVNVIKTGYVADAGGMRILGPDGQVHFGWHESQAAARHHMLVVREAAERRIAINPHEPIKDTGLRRTYPNWVSREGARGMEFSAWGQPGNPPEHEANLVFTRMLAGPMDYTPGILGTMQTSAPDGVATTWAKQLALYVVIYSPIQMAADLLESYENNPGPFQFIKDVPTDWSDTRVLNGEIGDFVTIARRDRNSNDWYLGSVTDEEGRTLDVPLSFLEPGRRYRAQIYRDGPNANWRGNREDIVIEERTVTSADTLTLRLAPGGGQAIRFQRR